MATINIDGHQVPIPDGLSQEDIDSIVSDYHNVVGPVKDSNAHFPSVSNLYKPINLKFGSGEDSHYVTTNNASLNADFTRAFGVDSGLFGKEGLNTLSFPNTFFKIVALLPTPWLPNPWIFKIIIFFLLNG